MSKTTASTTTVELIDCAITFPDQGSGTYTAVRDISLTAEAGKFTSVVGPTGSGKSTILNMSAGLLNPTQGTVLVKGRELKGLNKEAGYLFQQDALLPWRTALDNVALALNYRGISSAEAKKEATEWLARVGLKGFEKRFPAQLSGGQRRRVSMAQMWITNPSLILMDEPFSALDVQTRLVMEGELLNLWSANRAATLFVTHDLDEAVALSDEIIVLSAGPASNIVGRFEVPLERPRDLLEIKRDPVFQRIYSEVWDCLKEEVMKTYHLTEGEAE
ncbi:ABC transporter ATP-binding protein [Gulosibacter sp. ACHW.36C]|uniref:ABC transporter ATP-binding protein n=1 Tax=Gulosibacter sediminis TaxID=1729695 RepID=A0ABY4MX02_9MICO|nr:ABC transporter ATP-binding protein [Gulosibacter sediminis]UQN14904.1 ABC transporter ATP-binding protein [Gulosibacter sediminis]